MSDRTHVLEVVRFITDKEEWQAKGANQYYTTYKQRS
jgi:hypothetical protein